jgi:addiction module HigA family antidote
MNATKNNPFNPNYAVPPGAMLEEWLEERGMSQTALAERMDRPIKTINELIKGKTSFTQETAFQLEAVTGIEASFWTNADRIYQERASRLDEEERLKSWVGWARQFPFPEMVQFGWVAPAAEPVARVRALLRFFGVATPEAWEAVYVDFQVAYRKSPAFNSNPAHLGAWLRQGELEATKLDCEAYDELRFKSALTGLRRLTTAPPNHAGEKLVEQCKSAGVAVAMVPELSKTHVCGATRWVTPVKALIQMSLRYKTDDHLWFTFFHEAAHILLHGKKDVFVEFNAKDNPKEKEADRWAADFLVPPTEWRRFVSAGRMKSPDIQSFAAELGIHPSIVVGRLQHEKRIPFVACNGLKRRLRLVAAEASPTSTN